MLFVRYEISLWDCMRFAIQFSYEISFWNFILSAAQFSCKMPLFDFTLDVMRFPFEIYAICCIFCSNILVSKVTTMDRMPVSRCIFLERLALRKKSITNKIGWGRGWGWWNESEFGRKGGEWWNMLRKGHRVFFCRYEISWWDFMIFWPYWDFFLSSHAFNCRTSDEG